MRRRSYSVAPMTLAIVQGGMMDSNFRRAVSLASSEDNNFCSFRPADYHESAAPLVETLATTSNLFNRRRKSQ